ncbi:MAG: hypothetical protein A3F94_00170 [Candidatus Spechtbacteria bacterium RIFCSPLOWO2_12_FULL_38_22]|uniref:EfeO-type cupredoxin-like domain-containing protein n=1 Tax=Candidatus Spechtbacteria bacterium RIFCSPLOWO2_12_FULL_38_22 TaxID=1802165 RepID=A0A1G2HGM2_9BACT|nr:MAG: hypothetical protein A3E58_00170 [Candidatus Spechtbacteria bacterium RIFCSPHIGHO2_12_FULL_38_30]OGZ59996.1 MAG: hypothetical protein A3A00_01350 [Candidatus Spechtbacteria bacterium RIFCSPLOWO2_01_FULL_38_20]OGZ61636.1 MAG: hypothetical protein A3F94_00170 [Candidatus Spechtbacteria bacterium RIFCSPLOWO2_12_FULL_38_22]
MKATLVSIIIAVGLVGGSFVLVRGNSQETDNIPLNNVTVVDGKQIIEIGAKGGYSPRKSIAKADLPTILRFETNGTFDCSSSVRIPSMNIARNLPPAGTVDINLGNPKTGTLQGICGMGMYPFEIIFKS